MGERDRGEREGGKMEIGREGERDRGEREGRGGRDGGRERCRLRR